MSTTNTFSSLKGLYKDTYGKGKMVVKQGSTFGVKSEKGKNLGSGYKTKEEANKRLGQVEYFKHLKSKGYLGKKK
jgi:hypothetical protein